MAKSIIDDIRQTEKTAQQILEDAEKAAREIEAGAQAESDELLNEAVRRANVEAQAITDEAKKDSDGYLEEARKKAKDAEKQLCDTAAENTDAAIDRVIQIITSA